MNDVKTKLIKTAKWLKIATTVAKILTIVIAVYTAFQIVAVFALNVPAFADFLGRRVGDIDSILGRSAIFSFLFKTANLGAMNLVYQKAIELFITLLSLLVLLYFINFFKAVLSGIVEDQQPFSPQTARRMKKGSYGLLLLFPINPVLGIVLLLLMRFLSLIFEYGAYLQEKADKTNRIQEEVIVSLAEITENKSEQTGQHIRRVSEYSRILATRMGLPEEAVENLRLASTMHDLGKLLIPSEILEKPGRLTDEEFAEIKKHPGYGEHLLHNVEGDTMTLAREIALEHHERFDGKGYPNGQKGDSISLQGRIVAVADVYDALTSRRSYKDAWDPKQAYDEIVRCSGTQFDPAVVNAFVAAYDEIDAARRRYADDEYAKIA